MKISNLVLFVLLTVSGAEAQWSDFSTLTASTNLSGAMNGKMSWRTGTGALPGTCKTGFDGFLNTATSVASVCGPTDNNWITVTSSAVTPITASYNTSGATCTTTGGGSCTASSTAGTDGSGNPAPGVVITHSFGQVINWPICATGTSANALELGSVNTTPIASTVRVQFTSANVVTITFNTDNTGACQVSTGGMGPAGPQGPTGPAGGVTSVATTGPITGGTITTTGTIACATCVAASSPGVGVAHFAGSTQTVTSSAVALGTADVSGTLPYSKGGRPTVDFFTGPQTTTNITGSDIVLAQTGSLPALAAGNCFRYEFEVAPPTAWISSNPRVWYGTTPGTTGSNINITSPPTSGTTPYLQVGEICNVNGSQTVQVMTGYPIFQQSAGGYGGPSGALTAGNQTTTATNLQIGVTLQSNGANFNATLIRFHVWSEGW